MDQQWPLNVFWKSALPAESPVHTNLPSVPEVFLGVGPEEEPPQGEGEAVLWPWWTAGPGAMQCPGGTQGRYGGRETTHPLFGRGALGTPRRVTVWEPTLPAEPPVPSGSRCGVCRPVSAPSSWATLHVSRALCPRPLGLLLLPVLGVGLVVVEVDGGLHRETGQHFLPGTLQILSAL